MTVIAGSPTTSPQTTAVVFRRSMSTFVADCVVSEQHEDTWTITDHPVEQGSTISDHVYKNPGRVTLIYVWSMLSRTSKTTPNNAAMSATFLQQLYTKLLQIQSASASGIISTFAVYTGKRVYLNCLVESMSVVTDKSNENVLSLRVTCKEMLIVTTQTSFTNASTLTSPQNNQAPIPGGTNALQPGSNYSDSD